MKAKFNITLPEVNVTLEGTEVKVLGGGNIASEVEFAPSEIKDMYDIQKGMLKELPEILKSFAVDVCRAVVEGKNEGFAELMKDEDFKATHEENKRRDEEFKAAQAEYKAKHETFQEEAARTLEALKQWSCIKEESKDIERQ